MDAVETEITNITAKIIYSTLLTFLSYFYFFPSQNSPIKKNFFCNKKSRFWVATLFGGGKLFWGASSIGKAFVSGGFCHGGFLSSDLLLRGFCPGDFAGAFDRISCMLINTFRNDSH